MKRYVIRKGDEGRRANAIADIAYLDPNKDWSIEIKRYRKNRSNDQNSFLHGVPLKIICDHTGYDLEDMKTYLLGAAFGWDEYEMLGERRKRPIKRSSDLTTLEFTHWLEWIERWASEELGLIIPKPNEHLEEP
jgi:hypothetical protein